MTRFLASCLGTATLLAALAPAAGGGARDASARLVACVRAADQAARGLTAEGTMRAGAPGERMQMRFALYRATRGGRLVRVAAPGLAPWNNASPGITVYRFRERIRNLRAPAAYVVRVTFRWLDADGDVLRVAVRRTRACAQPDPRPNLRIAAILPRAPGPAPGTRSYPIVVHNAGRSASGEFDVVLTVDGVPREPVSVESLTPGQRRTVTLAGPRCQRAASFRLDPEDRVDEAREADNLRALDCSGA